MRDITANCDARQVALNDAIENPQGRQEMELLDLLIRKSVDKKNKKQPKMMVGLSLCQNEKECRNGIVKFS